MCAQFAHLTLVNEILAMATPLYAGRWLVAFDDSDQMTGTELVTFCGFAAHNEDWHHFAGPWVKALERADVPYLRMAEAMNWRGPFSEKQRHWGAERLERRTALLLECAAAVSSSRLVAVAVAQFLDHFQKPTARNVAKQRVFRNAIQKLLAIVPSGTVLGLMCDDSEELAIDSYRVFRKLRLASPQIKDRVWTVCFGDDKKYQPLQAADMIAYYTRAEALRRRHRPSEPPDPIYQTLTAHSEVLDVQPIEQFYVDADA